ncbi:hypothetical protein ACFWNT_47785 [Streptomyces sp. NPDC058409]|uniref:hypothetical protein n=1 Tax=Streptomyces sp. NPDC058409 TaxID=3346484 RepID=UPI0036684717
MNQEEMVALWEQHTAYEFVVKDADLAVATMVEDASVMHLPTMSGGFGKKYLRGYLNRPGFGRDLRLWL